MHLLEWERNDCNITMLAVPTEGISFCICHFASKQRTPHPCLLQVQGCLGGSLQQYPNQTENHLNIWICACRTPGTTLQLLLVTGEAVCYIGNQSLSCNKLCRPDETAAIKQSSIPVLGPNCCKRRSLQFTLKATKPLISRARTSTTCQQATA